MSKSKDELIYEKYVIHGKNVAERLKSLENSVHACQVEIARLALKVCEIRHGGISNDLYTITRFADDIGINRKTVSNWTLVHRGVIEKIGIDEVSAEDWSAAMATTKLLKNERTAINASNNDIGGKQLRNRDIPDEVVRDIFTKIRNDKNTPILKFDRIYSQAKHLRSMIRDTDLSECSLSKMESVESFLAEALSCIKTKIKSSCSRSYYE